MFGSSSADTYSSDSKSGGDELPDKLSIYLKQSLLFEEIERITYFRYRLKNTNLWIDYFERGNSYKFGVDFYRFAHGSFLVQSKSEK